MANIVVFIILAAVILGSAIMCVTTKRIMRAATFLLFVLFGVAGIYFLLDYTFLGAAQIAALAGFATVIFVLLKNKLFDMCLTSDESTSQLVGKLSGDGVSMDVIGSALMGSEKYQYVLPFEFISIFLLACIIGGIVISRKDK